MLAKEGFDQWAQEYDIDVLKSEEKDEYPFAGYGNVLHGIYLEAAAVPEKNILDIGFGTAVLSSRLYSDGYRVFGIDFSQGMIDAARKKMPEALLVRCDFTKGLPEELDGIAFGSIIATYSLHHMAPERRPDFIRSLSDRLIAGGKILIGDVMFPAKAEYEACKERFLNIWDKDEIYITADELSSELNVRGLSCRFRKMSLCAGILVIEKRTDCTR